VTDIWLILSQVVIYDAAVAFNLSLRVSYGNDASIVPIGAVNFGSPSKLEVVLTEVI